MEPLKRLKQEMTIRLGESRSPAEIMIFSLLRATSGMMETFQSMAKATLFAFIGTPNKKQQTREERRLNQEMEADWQEVKGAYRQNRNIPSRAYLNEILSVYFTTENPAEQVCVVYELSKQNLLPADVNLVDALIGLDFDFVHIKESLSLNGKNSYHSEKFFLDCAAELEKSMK